MALFKIFRGTSNRLPQTITDSYAYFTTDDGKFYIDAEVNGELTRTCINPNSNWLAEGSGKDVIYNKPSQMTLEEVRGGHSTTPRLISPALLKALLDEKVSEIDIPPELIYPSNIKPLMNGAADAGTSMKYARGDHVHPSDTSRAPVKSPNFTGLPTAPTAAAGSNTSQIATTAFVSTAVAAAISQQVTYTLSKDEDNIILIGSDGSRSSVKDSQNILWFDEYSDFPIGGKADKIYIDKSSGSIYYWNENSYKTISSSIALGETATTAYRGDRGKIAFDHSQQTYGNPHNITKEDIGLNNVDNTADVDKRVSYAADAGTVNSLTVETAVPAQAKFTDTTYHLLQDEQDEGLIYLKDSNNNIDTVHIPTVSGEDAISVQIDSSAGNIFISRNISTTLTCTVYKGNKDITNQVQSFKWMRKNQYGVIDQDWTRIMTGNTIVITPDDVLYKAIFMCEVTL